MAWLILFSPLIACLLITLITLRNSKLSSWIAVTALLISLGISSSFFLKALLTPHWKPMELSIHWITLWSLKIEFGLILDRLSLLMLMVVTGIGSAIFIYSLGYMKEDPGKSRYFACLSLFAFSMLGIILSNNFIQMFIFWELVGASSYLLIGFWYEKDSAADAGNKAFLVNRVGDFGFMMGILLCWSFCGSGLPERTFNFNQIQHIFSEMVGAGLLSPKLLVVAGLLIFCGVLGKSAQFPLHVWLPDAMEGPTPVSALIHAATMVAAGIYLLARLFFLFDASPTAMTVIAYVGAFTSVFAASIAFVQNDIKRILAYSTLSQLGLMVLAMGLGGRLEAMYHLTTHAFFKALLFLGAGSVIHALHTQDIWDMGKLFKKMPITSITFLIGTLALCGLFPLSGFWSKDEILLLAFEKNIFLYRLASVATWMTSFYMARAFFVAFLAPEKKIHHPVHESSWTLTGPMIFLAIGACIAGFIHIPEFILGHDVLESHINLPIAFTSQAMSLSGIVIAFFLYAYRDAWGAKKLKEIFKIFHIILSRKYFMDDLYNGIVKYIQQNIAVLCHLTDRNLIVRFGVNGVAKITKTSGEFLRFCQTGRIQTYALFFFAGITVIVFVFILK
ncbi:MAG: NADH-quinone oxidoreductase subunit L [Chlamydiae bacterium]|nr:NADH-quinone oxidoreductase subunit L [Chlamydiota bacterium]MBI3266462.1 NADH-quinone oxidoreductase subunit L [Chlamydiota bacterium]